MTVTDQPLAPVDGRDGHYGAAATAAMGRLLADFQRMQQERDLALKALEEAYRDRLELAMAAEFASDEGAAHLVRVGCLAERLALAVGLPGEDARRLRDAAFLFGIGLRDVPLVLDAAGATVTVPALPVGADEALQSRPGQSVLELGTEVAYAWREHWDGGGVPSGLVGPQIPLTARLVALANLLDGLTRPERAGPLAWSQLLGVLQRQSGRVLDPALVNLAITMGQELCELMAQLNQARPSLAELARRF